MITADLDLKLYTYDSNVKISQIDTAMLSEGYVTQSAVSGLEKIVGKVVKYLLTEKGSDLFDPEYGSLWAGFSQVAGSQLSRLRITIDSDIRSCISYLVAQEKDLPAAQEKLRSVEFLGFWKDTSTGVEQVLMNIRVRTTLNNIATFNIGR
jgi:hypothetical protein